MTSKITKTKLLSWQHDMRRGIAAKAECIALEGLEDANYTKEIGELTQMRASLAEITQAIAE